MTHVEKNNFYRKFEMWANGCGWSYNKENNTWEHMDVTKEEITTQELYKIFQENIKNIRKFLETNGFEFIVMFEELGLNNDLWTKNKFIVQDDGKLLFFMFNGAKEYITSEEEIKSMYKLITKKDIEEEIK